MPFSKKKRFRFQILGFTSLAHAVHLAHASPTLVDTVGGEETSDSRRDSGDSGRVTVDGCFVHGISSPEILYGSTHYLNADTQHPTPYLYFIENDGHFVCLLQSLFEILTCWTYHTL
jgi:hypothetical protein